MPAGRVEDERHERLPTSTVSPAVPRSAGCSRWAILFDSCGSMGNQMLEKRMIRHPESRDAGGKEPLSRRIADWVVKKQERLPDGTFWRPKSMGGTLWPDDLYMGGVFLVRWGVYNHDQKFIEDAANNIIH